MTWKNLEPDFRFFPLASIYKRLTYLQIINSLELSEGIQIILSKNAEVKAKDFVSSIEVESGGLLLGKVFRSRDHNKHIVVIEESLPCAGAFGTSTSLRMDSTIWNAASAGLVKDLYVVGWFHSHPNLGAFFSSVDRKTQSSFFRESFHLGWVIDPIRNEEKWFSGEHSSVVFDKSIIKSEKF
jgi:proteasome lid subunit RPN8/RPN11